MNPNGFVLAARITSHTSMFIRSHNSAISFTSAMFTLRKIFSSSLVISAARALDTISTGAPMRFSSSAARCVARSFTPPTTLGVLIGVELRVAGIDPFGAEGQIEIDVQLQTRSFQDRQHHFIGGAGIRRALQHHQVALLQMRHDAFRRADDERQIGRFGRVVRRGHTDEDRLGFAHRGVIGGGAQQILLHQRRNIDRRHVGDVTAPRVQLVHLRAAQIDAHHRHAGPSKRHRQRQSHVSQPDDRNRLFHVTGTRRPQGKS